MLAEVTRSEAKRFASVEPDRLMSEKPVCSSLPYCRSKEDTASTPLGVNAAHCQNWSVLACPRCWSTLVSFLGPVFVPVKLAPLSLLVLTRMSLLQAPAVFTPVYRLPPVFGSVPVGTQPLRSLECELM